MSQAENTRNIIRSNMENKLYKSRTDRRFCGVCGGLANYLKCDSTLIRLAVVLATLCLGGGLLFYIIAAIVMPNEPEA